MRHKRQCRSTVANLMEVPRRFVAESMDHIDVVHGSLAGIFIRTPNDREITKSNKEDTHFCFKTR